MCPCIVQLVGCLYRAISYFNDLTFRREGPTNVYFKSHYMYIYSTTVGCFNI